MLLRSALLCAVLSGSSAFAAPFDVGTDVGANGKVHLYWVEADTLSRGVCTNVTPLERANCSTDVVPHSLADVRVRLLQNKDTRQAELSGLKSTLDGRLSAIDRALSQNPDDADLSYERTIVADQITVVAAELTTVTAYIQNVDKFIGKISTGEIVFHMMQNSDRYSEFKPLVALLADYYNEVPQIPGNPDVRIWQDPVTNMKFGAISRRVTHVEAGSTCRSVLGEGWDAIAPFSECANCTRNMALMARLIHSPLTSILPKTPYHTYGDFTRVWTNARYENDSPVSFSYSVERNTYAYTTHNGMLPLICETK